VRGRYFNPNHLPVIVQALPVQTLPAAGAYVASDIIPCAGFAGVTIYYSYARANMAGAVTFFCDLYLCSSTDAYQQGAVGVGAVVAGVQIASLAQSETITYTNEGLAGTEFRTYMMRFNDAVEQIRIQAAESGAVGNPGDFGAIFQFALE